MELQCKCELPANPDKLLVGCTEASCAVWLHYDCLLHDVLMRVFRQFGRDRPHKTTQDDEDKEQDNCALSPTEHKGQESHSMIAIGKVTAKHEEVAQLAHTLPGGTPENLSEPSVINEGREKKSIRNKPYQGLFDATLQLDKGPTVWMITDLRPTVGGGDRMWIEKAGCLICGSTIA